MPALHLERLWMKMLNSWRVVGLFADINLGMRRGVEASFQRSRAHWEDIYLANPQEH